MEGTEYIKYADISFCFCIGFCSQVLSSFLSDGKKGRQVARRKKIKVSDEELFYCDIRLMLYIIMLYSRDLQMRSQTWKH